MCTVFRGWCTISVFESCFWSKKEVSEQKNCAPFLGSLGFTSLLLHDVKKRKKEGQKKSNIHFLGGLENGQAVVPPLFSQKLGFSKFSKTPIFIAFPEKMGGNHFFEKGYVTRRTDLEGKNDNFLVSFRHKCLRRCQTEKRGVGGGGGRSPPPPKKKKKREAQSWQSSCCFCCCCLLLWLFCCCCCCIFGPFFVVCCCCCCCCFVFVVVVLIGVVIVFVVVIVVVLVFVVVIVVVVVAPEHPKEKNIKKPSFPVFFCLILFFSLCIFLLLSFIFSFLPFFPLFPSSSFIPSFLSSLTFLFLFLLSFLSCFVSSFLSSFLLVAVLLPFVCSIVLLLLLYLLFLLFLC